MTNKQRIEKLEANVRAQPGAQLWIDMIDNRVRIDINNKRGDELIFETVPACAAWVEEKMRKAETIRGLAFISNVADLFFDKSFTYTPDDVVNKTGVLMNLAGRGQDSLADMGLATWLHQHGYINKYGELVKDSE